MIHPELHSGNSEYRELSQKSRISEKATDEEKSRKTVHETFDKDAHLGNSESRKHSQNSQEKQAREDIGDVKVTVRTKDNQCSAVSSDFLEHSQNSLSRGELEVDKGEANMSFSDHDGQHLATASEFRELSSNSRVETECSEGTQQKQNTKIVCISKPSNNLRESPRGVGNIVSVPKYSWFKSISQIVGLTAA